MNINDPLISIIITCRNCIRTIKETLSSLKKQSLQSFEVIVVDAFSNDGTYEYLLEEQKRWTKLKVFRCHGNPAKGRNYGIARARGKYIAFIDADVYAEYNWLEMLLEAMKRYEKTDIVGVGGPGNIPPNDPLKAKVIGLVLSNPLLGMGTRNNALWRKPCYVDHHPFFNAMYTRWIFEKIGLLNEKLDVGEDVEFGWRIRRHGFKLLYIPNAVVYHHRRASILALAKQMFRYGYWRAMLRHIDSKLVGVKYHVPILLVLYTLSLTILVPLLSNMYGLLLHVSVAPLILYVSAIVFASLYIATKLRSLYAFPIALVSALVTHFSYGIGFLRALLRRKL